MVLLVFWSCSYRRACSIFWYLIRYFSPNSGPHFEQMGVTSRWAFSWEASCCWISHGLLIKRFRVQRLPGFEGMTRVCEFKEEVGDVIIFAFGRFLVPFHVRFVHLLDQKVVTLLLSCAVLKLITSGLLSGWGGIAHQDFVGLILLFPLIT